jgi:hypothetical protein
MVVVGAAAVIAAGPAQRGAPRTADGRPDLQGTWSFATLTPLERPAELAGKATLTAQEAAAYEAKLAKEKNNDRRDGAGTNADVSRAYNAYWIDWGNKIVGTRRTSLVVDPPDGRVPPLTPEGRRREEARVAAKNGIARGPEDRGLEERCLLGFNSGPPMLPGPYNNHVQIFQARDHIALLNEMVHNTRIVWLDGRPHVPATVHQWVGDSRGRWDGDTLVVETTNFTDKGTANFFVPGYNDERLRLTERFTPAGADTLMYEFTMDDPTTWTRAWTAAFPMTRTTDHMYEYACHEGNEAMIGILAGARAQDGTPIKR